MGPAAVRFIRNMSYDKKCFTSALLSMGTKGVVELHESKENEFTVKRAGAAKSDDPLTVYEEKLLSDLLRSSRSLKLVSSNHSKISRAITELRNGLRKGFHGSVFRTNRGWLVPGWILTGLGILVMIASFGSEAMGIALFFSIWLSIWGVGTFALISAAIGSWKTYLSLSGTGVSEGSLVSAITSTLFAIPFSLGWIVGLVVVATKTSWLMLPVGMYLFAVNYAFWWWIRQPTVEGQRIRDEIEGFRMYLGTAEREYVEQFKGPEKTPELFERYLPYAVALDVENEWTDQFTDVLAAASQSPGDNTQYHPAWYHGTHYSSFNNGAVVGALGTALSTAIVSSASAPASRSGGEVSHRAVVFPEGAVEAAAVEVGSARSHYRLFSYRISENVFP
ncbi:MAG: DUF2207 domain-containing protein [Pirellulaceae bacterium]